MARFESWQSVEFSTIKEGSPATIHTYIRAVSYSDALESELVRGAGRDILGSTDPIYMPGDMSLELYFRWARVFFADITNNGESRIGDHDLRMVLTHITRAGLAAGEEPLVDTIDFQIVGAEDTKEQGPEALVTVIPCLPKLIKRNGVQL